MYWHDLNQKRIEQLRGWLKGKRLLIVGNSVRMLDAHYGDLIDGYDTVVRIGKGLTDPTLHRVLGAKTDIWFSGMLRAGMHHKVVCDWKILTPSTSSTYDDTTLFIPVNKALFSTDFQPYKHYFWSDSIEGTKQYWIKLGFNRDVRPSQGIICIDFFARRVRHDSIDIIGFDFFTEAININGVQHSSWHLPLKTNPNESPHDGNLEKRFVDFLVKKSHVNIIDYR